MKKEINQHHSTGPVNGLFGFGGLVSLNLAGFQGAPRPNPSEAAAGAAENERQDLSSSALPHNFKLIPKPSYD